MAFEAGGERAELTTLASRAARAVAALGMDGFPPALQELAGALVDAPHISILRFDAELGAEICFTFSRGNSQVAASAAELYGRFAFHRHDPLWRISGANGLDGEPVVSVTSVEDLVDFDHRKSIYQDFNLAERYSIIGRSGREWLAVNFYREVGARKDDALFARFLEIAPVVHALAAKHLTLSSKHIPATHGRKSYKGRLALLTPSLTNRQIDVCDGALAGLTNSEIARELSIEVSTVSTLRRRAYERLEIASLAELFQLCLS